MIDPDRDLEMTLKLTRLLAEPSMADGARVLAAVHGTLAAAGASQALPRGDHTASRVQPRAAAAAKPALHGAALQQLITVGVVAAGLGFAAGWGLRGSPGARDVAPREVVVAPAPSEPARATHESPPVEQSAAPAAKPALEPPAASTKPAPEPTARPRARTPMKKPAERSTAPISPGAEPLAPPEDSSEFFEAVNLLRRAQRAVNRGDGQVALSLLGELDTRFDPKTLAEERQATRALALCASGDVAGATRVARELARVSPGSIYAARLRLSCTGWFSAQGEPEPRSSGSDAPGAEPPNP